MHETPFVESHYGLQQLLRSQHPGSNRFMYRKVSQVWSLERENENIMVAMRTSKKESVLGKKKPRCV